jgi:hypothetical protein
LARNLKFESISLQRRVEQTSSSGRVSSARLCWLTPACSNGKRATTHWNSVVPLRLTWSYGLDRFLLLYSDNGVVVGASYTDTHIELPVLWLLVGLAAIATLIARSLKPR